MRMLLFLLMLPLLCGAAENVLMDGSTGKPLPYSFMDPERKIVLPETYYRRQNEFRAFWISTVANLDFPLCKTPAEYEMRFRQLVRCAADAGFNAIFFQVRPCNDAFYKSRYNPWSRYLTGKEGTAFPGNYDPLPFMIRECHNAGMTFHAWLNPYRIAGKSKLSKHNYLAGLHRNNFAVRNPDSVLTVPLEDGQHDMHFLDPGDPQVLVFLINTVKELLTNYDLDGIHMDDYFYPYEPMGTQDNATYRRYAPKGMDIASWRRNNTDRLVQNLGQLIRKHNRDTGKSVRFGISPFGIWANITPPCPAEPAAMRRWQKLQCSPLGSETKGHQSHYELYANTRKWVKNNWIDYVIPQVYWGFSNPAAPFAAVVDWWAETVRGTQVTLYIGIGAYRMGVNEDCLSEDELSNQVIYCQKHPEIKGVSFFSSRSIFDAPPPVREAAFKTVFETLWGKKYTILR